MNDESVNFEDLLAQGIAANEPEVEPEAAEPVEDAATDPEADTHEVVEESPVEDAPVAEGEQTPSEIEWAKSVIGRQGQELGELRRQLEALAAHQQAQPEPDAFVPFEARVPTTPNELMEMASNGEDAAAAFEFAQQHAPDYLPSVLAEIRYHDPIMAEQLQIAHFQSLVDQRVSPVDQRIEAADSDAATGYVVANYAASVAGWEDIKDDVANILDEQPWLIDSADEAVVLKGLRAATYIAQQKRDLARTTVANQQASHAAQARQDATVETGTPSSAPAVENVSAADAIRNAIFAEDKRIAEVRRGL